MLALKESSLFLQVAELLQLQNSLETDQVFFVSLSNHFRDGLRDWSHYLKLESEQIYHRKMKKWVDPFFLPEREASYFEREMSLIGKKQFSKDALV